MAFKGKVVIVTGSSSGIGREAADVFAIGGAKVTLHGQSKERMQASIEQLKKNGVSESNIHVVYGPIEDDETRQNLIDETIGKFGRLDVLVNNAGLGRHKDLDSESLENLDYVMNANLRSLIALTRLAVPHLEKQKGNIVNVSSVGAQRTSQICVPYILSKAAVDHYTRNAAVQYADKNIRVNTVSPGATMTNFCAHLGDEKQGEEKTAALFKHYIDNIIPMHRVGEPREVANVIEFLASDKASYVTGSCFVVDGGMLAGAPPQRD